MSDSSSTETCPDCNSTKTLGAFKLSFDDEADGSTLEMCSKCFQSVFYRLCPCCGANNRSVYFCRNCHASLGSVSDIGPGTILLDSDELSSFTKKYYELFDNIPDFVSRSDIEKYVTSEDKRKIWHQLPFKEQLEYYRHMDKSYPPTCFNPNSFFGLFDRIQIADGYFLDYRYYEDLYCGLPAVFARKFGSKSMILSTHEGDEETAKVFDVLTYEESPMGLFQYALFSGVYDKFYTFAHSNYGEILPVLTHSQFEALILDQRYNIKDWAIELLQRQDVRPRVAMSDDGCGVTIFTYSRYYGFGWHKYKVVGKSVHEETYEQLTWPANKIKY